jgi:sec-independent protein translocase protein TatA
MHTPSIWAIIIIILLVVILFGRPGKLSNFMTDLGKGIKGFRSGLGGKDDDDQANAKPPEPAKQIPPIVEDPTSARRDRTGVDQ